MKSKESQQKKFQFMKLRRIMKAQNPKKKEKERNNNKKKKKEEDLDLVRSEDMQQDEHQGLRTLMCHFECLRRGPWLTYGKAKAYVQISSKKSH